MTNTNMGRIKFLLLVAVFALPVIAGWVLILNPGLLPEGRVNFGKLIQPVVHMPNFKFNQNLTAATSSNETHTGFWTMIFISDKCEDFCRQRIHEMRQVRKALEGDYLRIKRLLIIKDKPDDELEEYLLRYTGTGVLFRNLQIYAALEQARLSTLDAMYIMDPNRDLMMSYDRAISAEEILEDMSRLMKVNRGAVH